ncbi:hypothetical protein TI05_03700 [Achromatium sp. WMS3]|nr:hypothetical protein TI05_03700 [Achromatium sp. WMS3]
MNSKLQKNTKSDTKSSVKHGDKDYQPLKSVLTKQLHVLKTKVELLTQLILAILAVRSVNFSQLLDYFNDNPKIDVDKLQQSFDNFVFEKNSLAQAVVELMPLPDGPWQLTMDRSIWIFGESKPNILVLGIAHNGISIPLFWEVVDRDGHSKTAERINLMQLFIDNFGVEKIGILLADREFAGSDWFFWLQQKKIPFYQRIKSNTLVPDLQNHLTRLDAMFCLLKPGESCFLEGQRKVWGNLVHISAQCLKENDLLIIASSDAEQKQALDTFKRQQLYVKTLMEHLRKLGFNFDNAIINNQLELFKMIALLALAFAWDVQSNAENNA